MPPIVSCRRLCFAIVPLPDPTSLGAFDSPWHDTPLTPDGRPLSDGVVHMICEIPMGATAKLEIRPDVVGNPLLQASDCSGGRTHARIAQSEAAPGHRAHAAAAPFATTA